MAVTEREIVNDQNLTKKNHKCDRDGCNKSFRRPWELKRHIEAHLKGTLQTNEEELVSKKNYKCTVTGCTEAFTRNWALTRHLQKVHNPEKQKKDEKPKKDNKKKCYSNKNHKCDEPFCDAVFNRPYKLQDHKRICHGGKLPLKCGHAGCNHSYTHKAHLERHIIAFHIGKDATELVYKDISFSRQETEDSQDQIQEPITHDGTKNQCAIKENHKCDIPDCNEVLIGPLQLNNDKEIVHCSKELFICNYEGCDQSYANNSDLREHKISNHPDTTPELVCNAEKRHQNQQKGGIKVVGTSKKHDGEKKYKCDIPNCKEGYNRRHRLQNHKLKVHADVLFSNQERRGGQDHQERVGDQDCSKSKQGSDEINELNYHSEEQRFKCDYEGCDASYTTESHLATHRMNSHVQDKGTSGHVACNVEQQKEVVKQVETQTKNISKTEAVKRVVLKRKCDTEKKHKCDEPGCEAAFNRPYRLQNHKASAHAGYRPFICDYEDCDKKYTNESHLARHKIKSHCPETDTANEVICGVEGCGRVLANKYSLIKHLTKTHSKFPFPCTECDAKFKRKSYLHAHKVEAHGSEAPYKCVECPKTFIHYHLYNKHLKNHKTYQCDCKQTFKRWSELLEHRRSKCTIPRKEHKCAICDKTFSLKQALTQHSLMVHLPDTQIDLFRCPYLDCNHSYKYKKNLTVHIKSFHEKIQNDISFKCTEENCEMVLKSKKNLKQHLRWHSGLATKERKPRKPRKDKGIPKLSMAAQMSGIVVSTEENRINLKRKLNDVDGPSIKFCSSNAKFKDNDEYKSNKKTKVCTTVSHLEDNQEVEAVVKASLPASDSDTNYKKIVNIDVDLECFRNTKILDNRSKNSGQESSDIFEGLVANKKLANDFNETDIESMTKQNKTQKRKFDGNEITYTEKGSAGTDVLKTIPEECGVNKNININVIEVSTGIDSISMQNEFQESDKNTAEDGVTDSIDTGVLNMNNDTVIINFPEFEGNFNNVNNTQISTDVNMVDYVNEQPLTMDMNVVN